MPKEASCGTVLGYINKYFLWKKISLFGQSFVNKNINKNAEKLYKSHENPHKVYFAGCQNITFWVSNARCFGG